MSDVKTLTQNFKEREKSTVTTPKDYNNLPVIISKTWRSAIYH